MIPVPRRFWVLGFTAALVVHAAIFAGIFWRPAESGARGAGTGGIQVSLGPTGGSPGSIDAAADTPEAENVQPVEATVEPAPPETTGTPSQSVTTEPVDTATELNESVTAKSAETAEPSESVAAEEVETTAEARPVVKAEPVEAAVQPLEPIPEKPVEQAQVNTAATVESKEVDTRQAEPEEPEPEPVEEAEPKAAQTVEAKVSDTEQVARSAPSIAGSAGESGNQASEGAGSGEDASGGGVPGASADYVAQLRAWLEKHKRYPRRAQLRRLEGTALLHFVIDREGRVLEYNIREGSGHEILDEEVTAMIQRAQPLPGMPAEMDQTRLELVVPVQFFLM